MNSLKKQLLSSLFLTSLIATATPEKKFDQERYDRLNKCFDEKENNFSMPYIPYGLNEHDIEIIQQHKEQKEKELKDRKLTLETSWKPLIFKMLGGTSGIIAASVGINFTTILMLIFYLMESNNAHKIWNMLHYPTYPATSIMLAIYPQINKLDQAYDLSPGLRAFMDLGMFIGTGLLFGGIAKYFFKEAASYANKIKEIEKTIAYDEKMIKVLERYND